MKILTVINKLAKLKVIGNDCLNKLYKNHTLPTNDNILHSPVDTDDIISRLPTLTIRGISAHTGLSIALSRLGIPSLYVLSTKMEQKIQEKLPDSAGGRTEVATFTVSSVELQNEVVFKRTCRVWDLLYSHEWPLESLK